MDTHDLRTPPRVALSQWVHPEHSAADNRNPAGEAAARWVHLSTEWAVGAWLQLSGAGLFLPGSPACAGQDGPPAEGQEKGKGPLGAPQRLGLWAGHKVAIWLPRVWGFVSLGKLRLPQQPSPYPCSSGGGVACIPADSLSRQPGGNPQCHCWAILLTMQACAMPERHPLHSGPGNGISSTLVPRWLLPDVGRLELNMIEMPIKVSHSHCATRCPSFLVGAGRPHPWGVEEDRGLAGGLSSQAVQFSPVAKLRGNSHNTQSTI